MSALKPDRRLTSVFCGLLALSLVALPAAAAVPEGEDGSEDFDELKLDEGLDQLSDDDFDELKIDEFQQKDEKKDLRDRSESKLNEDLVDLPDEEPKGGLKKGRIESGKKKSGLIRAPRRQPPPARRLEKFPRPPKGEQWVDEEGNDALEKKKARSLVEERDVALRISPPAEDALRRCMELASAPASLQARTCLQRILDEHHNSTAALRAEAALKALNLRARHEVYAIEEPYRWPFAKGRLELSAASFALGVATGAIAGAVLDMETRLLPEVAVGTGGAVAVGLGGAFGIGSLLVGEFLQLDAGTSHLLASGIGWGAFYGLSAIPWVYGLAGASWDEGNLLPNTQEDFEAGIPMALGTTLAMSYAGAMSMALVAPFVDVDEGQVSTLNTGGWVGFATGLATAPMLGLFGVGHIAWLGTWYLTTTTLGLLGGAAMSNAIKLTSFDVWIIDALTFIALCALGGPAAMIGVASTAVPLHAVLGMGTGIGTLTALVGATAGVAWIRHLRGKRISRLGFLRDDVIFAPSEQAARSAPSTPLMSGRF